MTFGLGRRIESERAFLQATMGGYENLRKGAGVSGQVEL